MDVILTLLPLIVIVAVLVLLIRKYKFNGRVFIVSLVITLLAELNMYAEGKTDLYLGGIIAILALCYIIVQLVFAFIAKRRGKTSGI